MTPEATHEAAELLLAARRAGQALEALPARCRPGSLEAGYAIQAAFAEAVGGVQAGYKIGATSRLAQDFLGLDGPFYGRIFRGGIHESPAALRAGNFAFCLIEPEFAFRLAAPLPPRATPYDEAEVAAAVGAVHPAIEVITSAFGAAWKEAGAPALVADNGVHGAFVLGPECRDWRGLDLPAQRVGLSINGEKVSEGEGANAMGGPLTALTWLANALAGQRMAPALDAGDLVTTGVVTDFKLLEAGDEALADYGELGSVGLRFTA